MSLTLQQIQNRVKTIALAHNQVRSFHAGMITDYFNDQTAKYPAILLQDNGGSISLNGKTSTINYRIWFVDLVHVSADAKENEVDVQSDMVSIAKDILTQLNYASWNDWRIGSENTLQLVYEEFNDLVAGCYVDISIAVQFAQNLCIIPTDLTDYTPGTNGTNTQSDKFMYDETYIADGAEGNTITLPILKGKKILAITRESSVIYRTNINPASEEWTWDNTTITLGSITNPNERFLILYRNY